MLQSFKTFIQKENLFTFTEKVLLTVSGGIDSIVMCELFHQAGLKFGIAHCNFQLRKEESDADENFVEELAEKYNITFHSISFDTDVYAKKNKVSIQVAARELRYKWFEEIREQFGYAYIATAHHMDDSIETFFINLIRGTGISGLHGILPKQGKIIRPLLFTNKNKIEVFAKKNKLKHREDSSNASDKYVRNKIRHHIIPALKELNPDLENTINKDIERLRDVEMIYKKDIENKSSKIVKKGKNDIRISIKELKKLSPLNTYLYEFLKPFGFNSASIEEITSSLNGISGKQFFSPTHRLIKDREFLLIETKIKNKESGQKIVEKKYSVKKNQKKISIDDLKIFFKSVSPKNHQLKVINSCANLDLDKLEFPLEIRKWKQGDFFYPFGMKGKKKLSDFFIDKKFSLHEKENTLLMTSNDNIVWVIGSRIDDRFKITEKTKKIYLAELV